jgi:acetylornithine deacetylase/succinyl-diaminopimelate desuccinylase-like protein
MPPFPEGEHCQAFSRSGISDQNVVAHFFAKSPALPPAPDDKANPGADVRPALVVGAHYDAQGVDGEGAVYPGADDNASGVAALMEIARLAGMGQLTARHDLVLIAFGAEEEGALGAQAFVARPTLALERVTLMINLDMVGRQLLDGLPVRLLLGSPSNALGYVVSDRGRTRSEALVGQAEDHADVRLIGIPESVLLKLGFLSDSVVFSAHVPTLFLSTSIHHDYHQPTDTEEKVEPGQIERAVRVVLSVIDKS